MQFLRDQGFILKRVNFGDSDRYITIFTKNHGKIDVVAKGVRKINSRRAPSIEPLNLIDFQCSSSYRTPILTEVKLVDSFDVLKRDITHIKKVFLMCELIDAAMPFGVKHVDVFALIEKAASKIAENEKNIFYFQAKLLMLLGFWNQQLAFKDVNHLQSYTEEIIERKLKSPIIFDL